MGKVRTKCMANKLKLHGHMSTNERIKEKYNDKRPTKNRNGSVIATAKAVGSPPHRRRLRTRPAVAAAAADPALCRPGPAGV